ncbi:MAG: S26 family signal peptidase, partial [Tepidisphaeraceae bacterium]
MNDRSAATADSSQATNVVADAAEGGVKETIESILVAFILAFIFRAFVVEAFVIPTGSMAPTLLGAHMRFICNDCGYLFDTNFATGGEGDELTIPDRAGRSYEVFCPNCGYQIPAREQTDPAFNPVVRYGDRILVLKYLYLVQPVQRWDVVVFKSPDNPAAHDYTQNYIKRLIGRPGEAIMILDGDIYAGPSDANRQTLQIQTKPREVQESLWRIIYDNDYYPRQLERPGGAWRQPWTARAGQLGWELGHDLPAGRKFRFSNPSGYAQITFDPTANNSRA